MVLMTANNPYVSRPGGHRVRASGRNTYVGQLLLALLGDASEDLTLSLVHLHEEGIVAAVGVRFAEGSRHRGCTEVRLLGGVAGRREGGSRGSEDDAGGGAAVHLHAHIAGRATQAHLADINNDNSYRV